MKLVFKQLDKDGRGEVKLVPQEPEDMWHLYNLIAKGDHVTAVSFRKVNKESSTGSTQSEKVKVKVSVEVETIEFGTDSSVIRVKGRNVAESEFIKMGQFHTLELELQRAVVIAKDNWDQVYLERIQLACDPTKSADVAAVLMQDGLAHVLLLTSHMTLVRAKIEVNIPRKRMGSTTAHDKAVVRFYDSIIDAILRHVDFEVVKCVILASPAFLKDEFLHYFLEYALKNELRKVLDHKHVFLPAHAPSGHKHALQDVLSDEKVCAKINDTKAYAEVKALNDFFAMLNTDPDRAYYGFDHVRRANEVNAVEILLVTDSLFRASDVKTRHAYVSLVDSVKNNGGDVFIFSALHVSGEQLAQMSGIAAILRFPLPEPLSDHEADSDDDAPAIPAISSSPGAAAAPPSASSASYNSPAPKSKQPNGAVGPSGDVSVVGPSGTSKPKEDDFDTNDFDDDDDDEDLGDDL